MATNAPACNLWFEEIEGDPSTICACAVEKRWHARNPDSLRPATTHEETFVQWSGMSDIIETIGRDIGMDGNGKLNGWSVLAVVIGIGPMCERLTARLDSFVLVSGLLITLPIGLILDIPDAISQRSMTSVLFRHLFVWTTCITIIAHFCCIILATLISSALRVGARDADRWRLVTQMGMFPAYLDALFTIGNFGLCFLMCLTVYPVFAIEVASGYGVICFLSCGVAMHYVNSTVLLRACHPIHGWLRSFPSQFDLRIPFGQLEQLAKIDEQFAPTGAKVVPTNTSQFSLSKTAGMSPNKSRVGNAAKT